MFEDLIDKTPKSDVEEAILIIAETIYESLSNEGYTDTEIVELSKEWKSQVDLFEKMLKD